MSLTDDLIARRTVLSADLDRLTEPPEPGASVNFGKRIGEGTSEAVERLSTTAAARSIASSIEAIDRALDKIAAGSYGVCDRCNDAITPARLTALPATAHCVACAAAL
jgi:DnaK suppressor protein